MAVNVYIPTPFRRLTGNRTYVEAHGRNVAEVLADLDARFPGVGDLIFDRERQIPAHINVYVNNREIHSLDGAATPVADGDEVAVIPAIAGGAEDAMNGANEQQASGPRVLTPDQVMRYSRHIIMPQVGPVGQRKLMGAKVLIVGAGGLGSPIAVYLALAGVGTIGIVDFDIVDLSNLQRQILHQTDDVGRPKVVSARETLNAYNTEVNVIAHEAPLTSENALEIIPQYDIVVNGADNFATRYLVNDACYLAGKPLVDGSILLFDGQATTFLPGKGCYRCLFPEPPPPGLVPSCAEAGVLGALCGTIGSIQATEVLKLILGAGEPLAGRLLLYDALSMEVRIVKTRRDPNCPLCGDNPTIHELIDYDAFCGGPPLTTVGAQAAH
jgi:molybdopterin/thiamine biosynthesis adenylyltransferase/molybdopterin converting factor small subunit